MADPLADKAPWEDELVSMEEADERSVLITFGTSDEPPITNPLVHTIRAQSPLLARHNIEILTSPIVLAESSTGVDAESFKDAALVPMAATPKSFSGSHTFIRYPVHRTIIVAEGLKGCMMLGKQDVNLMRDQASVMAALNLSQASTVFAGTESVGGASVVDVIEAEQALDIFRASNQNGLAYERGWFASGLPALTSWLDPKDARLEVRQAVGNLVDDMLQEVSENVQREERDTSAQTIKVELSQELRQPLDDSVRFWAQRAHTELRDELDAAFQSRTWTKLKWWKLFWRVDDVSMFLHDVIERNWLVDAEKRLLWLIGRCTQAGIYSQFEADLEIRESTSETAVSGRDVGGSRPLPFDIMEYRRVYLQRSIPALQALSQSLVLQTASISGAGVALSGLLYASLPWLGLYEAGSVGALAIVWALRRLQRQWEASKAGLQQELREGGRRALQRTEEVLRAAIKGTDRAWPENEVDGAQERAEARAAVREARAALETLRQGSAR